MNATIKGKNTEGSKHVLCECCFFFFFAVLADGTHRDQAGSLQLQPAPAKVRGSVQLSCWYCAAGAKFGAATPSFFLGRGVQQDLWKEGGGSGII